MDSYWRHDVDSLAPPLGRERVTGEKIGTKGGSDNCITLHFIEENKVLLVSLELSRHLENTRL